MLPWTARFADRSLAPFAHSVLALDQSTLDAVRRTCADVRAEAKDSPRLLCGQLAGLFDVRRQQWVRLLFREDVFANEKAFVEELLAGLVPGSLILQDLGYFSFPLFDRLSDLGCWWLSRVREKTSYRIEYVFVQQGSTLDALIWLGAYRSDRAAHLVRLIQFLPARDEPPLGVIVGCSTVGVTAVAVVAGVLAGSPPVGPEGWVAHAVAPRANMQLNMSIVMRWERCF